MVSNQIEKEEVWTPVKINNYNKKNSLKRVGKDRPFPSLQQLVNTAVREFNDNHPFKESKS